MKYVTPMVIPIDDLWFGEFIECSLGCGQEFHRSEVDADAQ